MCRMNSGLPWRHAACMMVRPSFEHNRNEIEVRERERERETDRQTDRQRERERETDRQTDRETEREREWENLKRERERKREIDREREREVHYHGAARLSTSLTNSTCPSSTRLGWESTVSRKIIRTVWLLHFQITLMPFFRISCHLFIKIFIVSLVHSCT